MDKNTMLKVAGIAALVYVAGRGTEVAVSSTWKWATKKKNEKQPEAVAAPQAQPAQPKVEQKTA